MRKYEIPDLPSLIMVPPALALNWEREATIWLKTEMTEIVVLSQDKRSEYLQSRWKSMDDRGVPLRNRLVIATMQVHTSFHISPDLGSILSPRLH